MKLKIANKSQFYESLQKRLGVVPVRNAQKACFKAANLVKNEAQKSILQGAKTGPTVTRYNPKRTIAISAPGEPPASDTGFLANNITSEVRTEQGNRVFGVVRSTAPYSAFLEFGTTKMAARPFLQPALNKSANKIKRIFEKEGMIS